MYTVLRYVHLRHAFKSNIASSIELYIEKQKIRLPILEPPFRSSFASARLSLAYFHSFRNTVWAVLFFSCNHCNILSFITQSHPALDACTALSTETQRQTERSRPALRQHSKLPNIPCFPIVSRCFENFHITSYHPNPHCTSPAPLPRK